MKLTLSADEFESLRWQAEKEYLYTKGFSCEIPILRNEIRDTINVHGILKSVEYQQDNTPTISGDNIECEYLKAMS